MAAGSMNFRGRGWQERAGNDRRGVPGVAYTARAGGKPCAQHESIQNLDK